MAWRASLVAATILCLGSFTAWADDPPAVPIRDLPPLPDRPAREAVDDLTVTSASEAQEEVVVGASKREQTLGTVASAVTVISRDRLRRWGYRTLAEALRGVVGLYIVDDRNIERLGIRGVQLLGDANTRILVLIDGSPLNEPWGQFVDAGYALPVLLDDVQRIEVIRGPVSSIYGTNAFFGIINVISLDADEVTRGYGRIDAGSWGTLAGSAGFALGNVHRQARGFVGFQNRAGETITYEPYRDVAPDFTERSSADATRAVIGGFVVHYDQLFFQLRAAQRRRELPAAPYSARFASPRNYNSDRIAVLEGSYTAELDQEFTLNARVFGNYYRRRSDLSFAPNPGFRSEGRALWLGTELRGITKLSRHARRLRAGSSLDMITGLDAALTYTDAKSFDPGVPGRDPKQIDVSRKFHLQGLYAELEGRTPLSPQLTLGATAGARYDRNSEFDSNVSPRAALFLHQRNRAGIKLLYAQGFRNPSIFEAFFNDEKRFRPTCVPACELGSTLSSEHITSYEGVLWGRPMPGIKLRLSAWQWKLTRLIEKERVFGPNLEEGIIQFGNIFFDVVSRGIELEAGFRNTEGWLGFASATLARVEREDVHSINAPALTAKLGISSPRLAGRVHLSTEASFVGSRGTRDRDTRSDPHVAWNATLYAPSYRGVDMTLGIRNILGLREQIPAQADYDRQDQVDENGERVLTTVVTVPGAGRELFVRLGYAF